jgi:hypothetical protein
LTNFEINVSKKKKDLFLIIYLKLIYADPVLRFGSAADSLMRSWVGISPEARMSVSCECYVLLGRGFCEGLITRKEIKIQKLRKISNISQNITQDFVRQFAILAESPCANSCFVGLFIFFWLTII